jgi:hypothetical protein
MTQLSESGAHSRKAPLHLVRGALDEHKRRGASALGVGPFARRLQQEIRDHGSLEHFLAKTGASRVVDAPTLRRALGVPFFIGPRRSDRHVHVGYGSVDIITSMEQSPTGADITCLDVTALGGVSAAVAWTEKYLAGLRTRERLLIGGIGQERIDLAKLASLVNGVVTRPRLPTPAAWRERIAPVVKALRTPENVDTLRVEELQGGISEVEFKETLAQAALPDTDPRKRD